MNVIYVVSASYHYETSIIKAFNIEEDAKKLVLFLKKEGEKDKSFNQANYEAIELE